MRSAATSRGSAPGCVRLPDTVRISDCVELATDAMMCGNDIPFQAQSSSIDGASLRGLFGGIKAARMSTPLKPLKPAAAGVALGYGKPEAPKTPIEARTWIQEAILTGRYIIKGHAKARLVERGLVMRHLFHVMKHPSSIEPHDEMPKHYGSCWRVTGRNLDGEGQVAIGVEAYTDDDGRKVAVCTIFPVRKRRI